MLNTCTVLGTAGPGGESWNSESRETLGQWRIV